MNKNQTERDALLEPYFGQREYSGGIRSFQGLPAGVLQTLLDRDFAEYEDVQNEAPSLGEILGFLHKHPTFVAHGYAVSADRGDYRISIEGVNQIGLDELSKDELVSFTEMFRRADEFSLSPANAWFD